MKVKDLLSQEIDIDMYDSLYGSPEGVCVAFVGAKELTSEGEQAFEDVLNLQVSINRPVSEYDLQRPQNSAKLTTATSGRTVAKNGLMCKREPYIKPQA